MAERETRTSQGKAASSGSTQEDLERQLEVIRADIAEITSLLGALAKEKLQEFEDGAGAAADAASTKARQARKTVEDKVGAAERAIEAELQEHPWQSLALAFGFGVLISLLFRR